MRIQDIAKIAGVSTSTVSKIVNGKDQNISSKTRERVLQIVKEYNYRPYSSVIQNSNSKTFLLGFLCDDFDGYNDFVNGMLQASQTNNYSLILCNSFGDSDEELKNITRLVRSNVDAVLWSPLTDKSRNGSVHFDNANIPFYYFNPIGNEKSDDLKLDYESFGYQATKLLIDNRHKKIGYVSSTQCKAASLVYQGYERCLFEHNMTHSQTNGILLPDSSILRSGFTGVICFDESSTNQILWMATTYNLRIPDDISIIVLSNNHPYRNRSSKLSCLVLPWTRLGYYSVENLIANIENKDTKPVFDSSAYLSDKYSISTPPSNRVGDLVIVGSINMDIIINTETPLSTGVTTTANSWRTTPGGKGLNQSVGAARMGGHVHLIGKMGKDYDSEILHNILVKNYVGITGVSHVENLATGKAYVAVQQDGESSIAVFAGANASLSPDDIEAKASLFDGAAYCLLPMEIPRDTVYYTAHLAHDQGVKLIVKPTYTSYVSDELLELVDIFIPNRKEALALCGPTSTVEEQAEYFLEKGVKIVIITLGSQGCYLRSSDIEKWVPAINVKAIDTTGGADAFISTLATLLAENISLVQAVKYANYAAGLSVMRIGVVDALVDRSTLDLYYNRQMYLQTENSITPNS